MTENKDANDNQKVETVKATVSISKLPCHKCGCERFIDFIPEDGLCDDYDFSTGDKCQHPIESHY